MSNTNTNQNTLQQATLTPSEGKFNYNFSGTTGFQPGVSAVMTCILALIEALNQIQSMKNNLFASQVESESQMTQAYAQGQEQLGEQEFAEYLGQGIGTALGGLGQLGAAGLGMYNEKSNLGPMKAEINGSEEFSFEATRDASLKELDKQPTGTKIEMKDLSAIKPKPDMNDPETAKQINARADELLEQVKSGEFKLVDEKNQPVKLSEEDQEVVDLISDEKLQKLNQAAQERVSGLKETYKAAASKVSERNQTLNNVASGINGITTGTGQSFAAQQKAKEGQQQADNTNYQAAQQQFSKMSDETQSQADKDTQTAQELTQVVVSLSQANRAILNA